MATISVPTLGIKGKKLGAKEKYTETIDPAPSTEAGVPLGAIEVEVSEELAERLKVGWSVEVTKVAEKPTPLLLETIHPLELKEWRWKPALPIPAPTLLPIPAPSLSAALIPAALTATPPLSALILADVSASPSQRAAEGQGLQKQWLQNDGPSTRAIFDQLQSVPPRQLTTLAETLLQPEAVFLPESASLTEPDSGPKEEAQNAILDQVYPLAIVSEKVVLAFKKPKSVEAQPLPGNPTPLSEAASIASEPDPEPELGPSNPPQTRVAIAEKSELTLPPKKELPERELASEAPAVAAAAEKVHQPPVPALTESPAPIADREPAPKPPSEAQQGTRQEARQEAQQEVSLEPSDGPASEPSLLRSRSFAALIDISVACSFFVLGLLLFPDPPRVIPFALGALYLLTKDSLGILNGQSIGKKIMRLRAVNARNRTLAGNYLAGLKRNLSWAVAPIEFAILYVREDEPTKGRRLGDDWAQTSVVVQEKSPVRKSKWLP